MKETEKKDFFGINVLFDPSIMEALTLEELFVAGTCYHVIRTSYGRGINIRMALDRATYYYKLSSKKIKNAIERLKELSLLIEKNNMLFYKFSKNTIIDRINSLAITNVKQSADDIVKYDLERKYLEIYSKIKKI